MDTKETIKHPPGPFCPKGLRSVLIFTAVGLAGLCLMYWWSLDEKPESLFRRALAAPDSTGRIRYLERAVQASGGNFSRAEFRLCLEYARQKDWGRVTSHFQNLMKAAPSFSEFSSRDLVALAELTLESHHWDVATEILGSLRDDAIPEAEKLLLFCALYRGTNQPQPLIESAKKLTQIEPSQSPYWRLLAQIYEQLSNVPAAIGVYEDALRCALPPRDLLDFRYRLLAHSIDMGDIARARRHYEFLSSVEATSPQLGVLGARLAHLEGHPKQALQLLELASRELGEVPEAIRLRGILHLELGQLKLAEQDLLRASELTPNDEIVLFKLSEVYRRLAKAEPDLSHQKLAEEFHLKYRHIHQANLKAKQLSQKTAPAVDLAGSVAK